jgi:UBX domain
VHHAEQRQVWIERDAVKRPIGLRSAGSAEVALMLYCVRMPRFCRTARWLTCALAHVQTVGDLRSFIAASRPDLAGTSYRLATAFPAAELTDDAATIQGAGLANAVVVQKPA